MPEKSRRCPKCDGRAEQGFVIDHTHGGIVVSRWVEGQPHKSFWMKVKMPKEKSIPIGTFRCASCGYLESFALPEYEAG